MKAVILGSGFNDFLDHCTIIKCWSFKELFYTNYQELEGHQRSIQKCIFNNEEIVVIAGKLHYYEGFNYQEMIMPLKFVLEEFRISEFYITSASGAIDNSFDVGKLYKLTDVISFPKLDMGVQIWALPNSNPKENRCTYVYQQGPSLGTPAEYKMLHKLGANLVGMSMYQEYIYLNNQGVKSYFYSVPVCQYFPFMNIKEPTHAEVLKIGKMAVYQLIQEIKCNR